MRRLQCVSSDLWMIFGDFNEIIYQHEKEGVLERSVYAMAAFQDVVTDCRLLDLGYNGPAFTWRNGRAQGSVRLRLDRAFATAEWIDRFPHHRVFHLTAPHSDHLPILVKNGSTDTTPKLKWGRIPRFEPYWLHDEEFKDVLKETWSRTTPVSNATSLVHSLENTRASLNLWSKKKHGMLSKRIKMLEENLSEIQGAGVYTPEKESLLMKKLEEAQAMNEDYWRQRGRADWLANSDKNTAYFHHKASSRKEQYNMYPP